MVACAVAAAAGVADGAEACPNILSSQPIQLPPQLDYKVKGQQFHDITAILFDMK
jgi:hypothetical protein